MKLRLAYFFILFAAIGVNVLAEISAQQPKPPAIPSIQDQDRAKERLLAQADPKKPAPKEEVHGRGLVKPADLDARIAASWAKHGKKLKALPTVTATSFDCRDMGWVPPFDDQGSCGDCWVFSGIDPCCAALYKAGKLKAPQTLSKQMALDCNFRDACGGGWPEDAAKYVRDHGVATDADYPTPYHAGPGTCKSVDPSKIQKVLEIGFVAQNGNATYQQLKDAMVKYGVLSICYDAGGTPTGPPDKAKVWKGNGGTSIDHAIKVIAFDDSLSPRGAILCWNQWYNDNRDLWWAEYGANGLGDSLMFVDAGEPLPPPPPPVPDGAPNITSAKIATAQINQPFTFQFTAVPAALVFLADPLPPGLTLDAIKGTISGTPTALGTTTANVTGINAKGSGTSTLAITITDKPVPPPPPPPDGGFTGSVTTTYKNGVITSVTVGTGGTAVLEADLKNAGISPAIIADVIKFIIDLQNKQPYGTLIADVLKIVQDLVTSKEEYQAMPRGAP